jgi:hypothetical protein
MYEYGTLKAIDKYETIAGLIGLFIGNMKMHIIDSISSLLKFDYSVLNLHIAISILHLNT